MKKVYIVDDDRDIVEALSMVLESKGYETGHQLNEESVVENVRTFAPDLLVLDVMFPEDDGAGFKIARDIKAQDDLAEIPIVMLSAINEKGSYAGTFSNRDRDESYLPVSEFLEKPVAPAKLIEKVEALIGAA